MTGQTDWITALAILAAGLIAGSMVFYFFGRRRTTRPDLEALRDALIEQIRDSEGDERMRLERQAADVLRQIDDQVSTATNLRRRDSSSRPLRTTWVAATATLLAIVGLAWFVKTSATPRAPQPSAEPVASGLKALEMTVLREPDNLRARVDLARAYIESNNLEGVLEQTQYVLAKSPEDSGALTYEAIVRMNMGDNASAKEMLQRALKSDPDFLDAYVTTAWLQTQSGEAVAAEMTMAEALRRHPEAQPRLEPIFSEMRRHPVAPAAAGGEPVRISLSVDAARRGTAGAVFVIARPAGGASGHPLAVKRIELQSLPATFDFGDADTMMGQPLPQTMRIEARLDRDGDVTTKDPSDPFAMQDGVAPGSTVTLALK